MAKNLFTVQHLLFKHSVCGENDWLVQSKLTACLSLLVVVATCSQNSLQINNSMATIIVSKSPAV